MIDVIANNGLFLPYSNPKMPNGCIALYENGKLAITDKTLLKTVEIKRHQEINMINNLKKELSIKDNMIKELENQKKSLKNTKNPVFNYTLGMIGCFILMD